MIYVSTSCVKSKKIIDSVLKLAQSGFKNIELSGGTEYYDNFENDLINLKKEFDLNYLIHNYFPPPLEHFVLNLASTDKDIYEKSLSHYKRAIQLAEKLNISNEISYEATGMFRLYRSILTDFGLDPHLLSSLTPSVQNNTRIHINPISGIKIIK